MLDEAKENLQKIGKPTDYFKGKILTADTNYHSHRNLKKCQKEELDAYIPDIYFRKRDPRFSTQTRGQVKKEKKFVLEDFTYNETKDQYVCPNGKIMRLNIKRHIQDRNIYRRYRGDTEAIKDHFVSRGIDPKRLTTKYFGFTKPVDSIMIPRKAEPKIGELN